jgi:hypothetical protein
MKPEDVLVEDNKIKIIYICACCDEVLEVETVNTCYCCARNEIRDKYPDGNHECVLTSRI